MFPSRRPSGNAKLPYWDWVKLGSGKTFEGWSAGPLVGVEVHYVKGSRACRQVMTGGALTCAYCVEGMPTTWRGYMPLWDTSGIRCVTIVGERYADNAMKIAHLEPVRVMKLSRQGSPISVSACAWTSGKPPIEGDAMRPQDLRPWLVRLWSDSALSQWLEANPAHRSGEHMELVTPSKVVTFDMKQTSGPKKSKRLEVKEEVRESLPDDGPLMPHMRELLAKALGKKPSRNGNGKKHAGGK